MNPTIISAIITAIATVIAAIITAYFTKQRVEEALENKKRYLPWIIGLSVGISMGMVSYPLIQSLWHSLSLAPPVKLVQSFNFEDSKDLTNTLPWISYPESQKHQLIISDEESHQGQYSLRLIIDTQAYDNNDEYGGIGIQSGTFPDITTYQARLITAWVYLPYSEYIQTQKFFSHLFAYVYDEEGTYAAIYGNDASLVPGKWTPVRWSAAYSIESPSMNIWESNLGELYLTVWSDKPYKGSIYFDDIEVYTDK